MFLPQLNYPDNLNNFFSGLFPLITYDVLPMGNLFEDIFRFSRISPDDPLTEQFNVVGYGSMFALENFVAFTYLFTCTQLYQ